MTARWRLAAVAPAAIIAVLLGGCASESSHASPSASASAASPSVEPSPTSSPSAAVSPAADPDDPSTWVLSDEGMGPFVLGMPFEDALSAVAGFEDWCTWAYGKQYPGEIGSDTIAIAHYDDSFGHAESSLTDGPRTAQGIGVGSTTDDVLAAYPDAVEVGRNLVYLQAGNMFFGHLHGESAIVAVGVTVREPLWEFCG